MLLKGGSVRKPRIITAEGTPKALGMESRDLQQLVDLLFTSLQLISF